MSFSRDPNCCSAEIQTVPCPFFWGKRRCISETQCHKGKIGNAGKERSELRKVMFLFKLLFWHVPVGNRILPCSISFCAQGSEHFTPSVGDSSSSKHLWEDLNAVFQNLQKQIKRVTCPRRAVSQMRLNCLNARFNSETTFSTPAHGAL